MAAQLDTQTRKRIHLTTGGDNYHNWHAQSAQAARKMRQILAAYRPISLAEMDGVALLNRTDTKFVLHLDQLAQALEQLVDRYRVLEISSRRLHAYQNLYFDTPDFHLFCQHHRGQRDRYKVRCREYVDSSLNYFEIKRKNNRNRTIKSRLKSAAFVDRLGPLEADFLRSRSPLSPQPLNPVLWNDFHRITLVSNHSVERLTLDINLGFSDGWHQAGLPGVAVAEVKQDGFSIQSDFMANMRAFKVPPQRFSKYCMGITLFYQNVKANHFKPRILLVERILRKGA